MFLICCNEWKDGFLIVTWDAKQSGTLKRIKEVEFADERLELTQIS